MIRVTVAVLLSGCSLIAYDSYTLCFAQDSYTAEPDECILLSDASGATLFRRRDNESCDGEPCLWVRPGETAYGFSNPASVVTSDNVECAPPPECADLHRVER